MGYQAEEKESLELFPILVIDEYGIPFYEYIWAYSEKEAEQKLLDLGYIEGE